LADVSAIQKALQSQEPNPSVRGSPKLADSVITHCSGAPNHLEALEGRAEQALALR